MLTMRQNKNKIQTNCAWNGYRTHAWLREFIGSRVAPAAWIDIYTWVIWNLPKNRGRKLNYPKQQQQRDGYRSENKTIKGTQNKKEEKKKRIKVESRIKKNGKSNENQQAQRASLQLTVISSTLLAQPYTTLPCPAQPPRCHINHISHATLCPLMSMPDICHGPWPMSYYLHNNTAPPPPQPYPAMPCQRVLQQQDRASLYLSHTPSLLSITAQIFRLKIKLVYLLFWKEGSFWVRQHMFAYFMLSRIVHYIIYK